jgi:hypothetical protein
MVDKQLRLQRYYFSYFIARRREKSDYYFVEWVFFFISITGKPCSYSPNEAAWNQIVLSEGFILALGRENNFPTFNKSLILN